MRPAPSRGAGSFPRHLTVGWALLVLLGLFPLFAVAGDLAADLSVGIPADRQTTFAQVAGIAWRAAQDATPGTARYVTLLEIGYAANELVFAVLFLLILVIPFRHGARWAWWASWTVLVADVVYTLTFGRHDPAILGQSLVVDVALPLLLLVQIPRFFSIGLRSTAQAGAAARAVVGSGQVLLVSSPHAGRAVSGLDQARRLLRASGFEVLLELPVAQVSRLPALVEAHRGAGLIVLAAGGDGTVGAVANCLADTGEVMGVLPLGTSNDFARSLGIPVDVPRAVDLLCQGKVATIDLGRLVVPGQPPLHFVHAATAGLNVSFARLATRASLRRRFGRLTYAVAAALTVREHHSFDCEIGYEDRRERLRLVHLSIINAPVFGGFLGMRMSGSSVDDRLLDVLAVEELPAHRVVFAAMHQLFQLRRPMRGVHAFHVSRMRVHTERPLEIALDGEVLGTTPADFEVAGEALRVITPIDFEDVD